MFCVRCQALLWALGSCSVISVSKVLLHFWSSALEKAELVVFLEGVSRSKLELQELQHPAEPWQRDLGRLLGFLPGNTADVPFQNHARFITPVPSLPCPKGRGAL